jgi:hypothetical protein
MKVSVRLISAAFSRVFRTSKEVSRELGPQLGSAVQIVSKLGAKRIREFIAALPIFVLFVRELLRQRADVQAQKQLFVVGAAAALSTLGLVMLGGVLSSLPVQVLLLFTHPFIGIPLLVSEGLAIAAVMVLLVWLIIYALNFVLADDPAYQRIRDEFLPPSTQAVLADVQAEIENGGADLESLRNVVQERLKARGSKADAEKLEKELQRLEKRFRGKAISRLSKVAREPEAEVVAVQPRVRRIDPIKRNS